MNSHITQIDGRPPKPDDMPQEVYDHFMNVGFELPPSPSPEPEEAETEGAPAVPENQGTCDENGCGKFVLGIK